MWKDKMLTTSSNTIMYYTPNTSSHVEKENIFVSNVCCRRLSRLRSLRSFKGSFFLSASAFFSFFGILCLTYQQPGQVAFFSCLTLREDSLEKVFQVFFFPKLESLPEESLLKRALECKYANVSQYIHKGWRSPFQSIFRSLHQSYRWRLPRPPSFFWSLRPM